jgi:hypothetical protein
MKDLCYQGQALDKKSLLLLKKERDAHQGKKKATMAKDSASATNLVSQKKKLKRRSQ